MANDELAVRLGAAMERWSLSDAEPVSETPTSWVLKATSPAGPYALKLLKPYGFDRSTPLWLYVLREAELRADGLTLGKVGARIVAEVLIGLIQTDPSSFLARAPAWTPTLTSAGSAFRMTDFLTFAGVDPASRHAARPDRA